MGAITQRDVIEFACIMAAEFPRCDGLPGRLNDLLKLARRYGFLQERACNESVSESHDAKCSCRASAAGTDGTVDCEHKRASDMLAAAFDFLAEHDGEEIETADY